MGLLSKKTEEEKAVDRAQKEAEQASKAQADAEKRQRLQAHAAGLPKFEYQVKRIGEDKQKGILGSQRMEEILNGAGAQGWEPVVINEERATFKRRLPD